MSMKKANDRAMQAKKDQMEGFKTKLKELESAEDELYLDLKANRLDDAALRSAVVAAEAAVRAAEADLAKLGTPPTAKKPKEGPPNQGGLPSPAPSPKAM